MGIAKQFRLKQREDFARLRKIGQSVRHPLVIVSMLPNDLEHNRYGFITGKRLGNAVTRNRLRRLMREAIRARHDAIRPGHDIALIARPNAVGAAQEAMSAAIEQTLKRAHLLLDEDDINL